jgi:hypothetical protein
MIIVSRSLGCDGDDCPNWTVEATDLTVAQIRREARRDGWVRRKGEDLCETCAQKEAK